MRIKPGADCRGLADAITTKLFIVEQCHRYVAGEYGLPLVITCGTDNHADRPGSLHPAGLAIDIRTRHLTFEQVEQLAADLCRYLDADYDVVIETDHLHLEYDPEEAGDGTPEN